MRVRIQSILWWFVAPLVLAAYTAAWLVPATWWYEPGSVAVADTPVGADPIVSISRTIKRDFDGEYTVSVWREPPDGHIACGGSDNLRYRGGLYRPHESHLSQWSDDPWCSRLGEGSYYAEACWTVLRPFWGIVPAKTVCATTNIFRVLPAVSAEAD